MYKSPYEYQQQQRQLERQQIAYMLEVRSGITSSAALLEALSQENKLTGQEALFLLWRLPFTDLFALLENALKNPEADPLILLLAGDDPVKKERYQNNLLHYFLVANDELQRDEGAFKNKTLAQRIDELELNLLDGSTHLGIGLNRVETIRLIFEVDSLVTPSSRSPFGNLNVSHITDDAELVYNNLLHIRSGTLRGLFLDLAADETTPLGRGIKSKEPGAGYYLAQAASVFGLAKATTYAERICQADIEIKQKLFPRLEARFPWVSSHIPTASTTEGIKKVR